MGPVPVVRIKHEASVPYGFLEINESDFDPEVHELFDESDEESDKAKEPVKEPAKAKRK